MTRWLDPEERAAWVRLAAVVERLPGLLEAQLNRDADLTHFEYWVLAMLSEAPDGTMIADRRSAPSGCDRTELGMQAGGQLDHLLAGPLGSTVDLDVQAIQL